MFAVVYIPQFSLQSALRHEPKLWDKPLALVDPLSRPPRVLEVTEPACAAGVEAGLTPTQALARCSQILIRSRSLPQESGATDALHQCAYGFSPHLEETSAGICTLDLANIAGVSGVGREALERWAARLQWALAQVHLAAAVGLGTTPNVARHAARWGAGIEVVEDAKTFIAALPVAALDPSPDTARLLQRWGLRTIGELLNLGLEALTARLGMEALALFAAASDHTVRPLRWTHPAERFEESFDFEPGVETLEPLLFLLRRFVEQLSFRLHPRGLVAETLVLQLGLESGSKVAGRLRLPQPTGEPDVLFRTVHTYLEGVRTESAVKTLTFRILPVQARQKQLGLFETILSDPHQFQETLARLSAVLGADRVGTPALENSHRPDTFRLLAPDFENAPMPEENQPAVPGQSMPLRRFRPALRAEVHCESRPISIRCPVARGPFRQVIGPWRASGHWWGPEAWEREEWDAATQEGLVIRLVHQPDGWFVEGVMD